MTSLLGSQHQARKPREWVQNFVGGISDKKFVDEGFEFGVQNALKLIFEHVCFQKFSGGLYYQTSAYQNVARFNRGWISFPDYGITQRFNITNGLL